MKVIMVLFLIFNPIISFSQHSPEEANAKKIVTDFFNAFHEQDSVALRKLAHSSITMQSIGGNPKGINKLSTSSYGDFLKSIVSIPSATKFEEKLHGFDIWINGPLAHVLTPYSFYINGELSHCGVNSFTLVKEESEWKISYLIDTRIREGCDSF